MPELTLPTTRVQASFLAAMAEFQAEGRGTDDPSMVGQEIIKYAPGWHDPAGFSRYVDDLIDQIREDAPRPAGYVPSTTFWWVSGEDYFGRISIRHRMTPHLLEYGGHIGYDVRPSARRRGHATQMLAATLPEAAALGIDSVLITCDFDNVGSRKVIEANGGILEDRRGMKLRFWVPTTRKTS